MKQLKDIMTSSPVSCKKTDTLQTVAQKMQKSNIGFIPVVDDNEKVIGTITDRDITLAIAKNNKLAGDIKVQDAMKSEVYTANTEDDTITALKIMRTKQIGRLPVVDNEKRLKGVISLTGIAGQIKNSSEKNELGYSGKENILNTLESLSERSASLLPVD